MPVRSTEAIERRKAHQRAYVAEVRATLTPEEKAERRRKHDEEYRRRHAQERIEYDRRRHFINRLAAFSRTRPQDVREQLELGRSFVVDKRSPEGRWV